MKANFRSLVRMFERAIGMINCLFTEGRYKTDLLQAACEVRSLCRTFGYGFPMLWDLLLVDDGLEWLTPFSGDKRNL